MKKEEKHSGVIKFLTEFVPLILFLLVYYLSKYEKPIIPATATLVIATFIGLIIAYIINRKIPMFPLISAIILGIFGGLTVFSGDDTFIKVKPTIFYTLIALTLFIGNAMDKPLLKYLLGKSFIMDNKAWNVLGMRWGIFFILMAICNELVWRNFSLDFWVSYKVFGILPLTILFVMANIPFITKNQKS